MVEVLSDPSVVAEIFQREFDSVPPDPSQGHVLAIVENGAVKAFIMRELLIRIGLLWVTPEERDTPLAAKRVKELLRYVVASIPEHASVISIDDTGEYARLFNRLGMRSVPGDIFRIDF